MARISTYPKDTNISLTDKLLGTDAQGSSATKNFEISDFISFLAVNGPVGPTGPTGPTGATGPTGPTGPAGSPNYLEFSAKLEQTDTTPPEIYGSYIDEISIGDSIEDPLYRGFLSSRTGVGTYRVGFEWIIDSSSAILPGKLEITMTGGNITVVAEEAYSTIGFTAGYRFTIEVRDGDGVLSDDALGTLLIAGIRFRLFNAGV